MWLMLEKELSGRNLLGMGGILQGLKMNLQGNKKRSRQKRRQPFMPGAAFRQQVLWFRREKWIPCGQFHRLFLCQLQQLVGYVFLFDD